MEISFEYWFMLPISIVIATIAMSSGIGGAVFFSPIFMLWLKLEPTTAVGIALITELFGFTSGLVAYFRARLIDFKLGRLTLLFSVPAAIIGVLVSPYFPPVVLKAIFAVGIIFIGLQIFTSWRQEQKEKLNHEIEEEGKVKFESEIIDVKGRSFRYTVCNRSLGAGFAFTGGAFLGMISVGLAELMEYQLVAKCRVPSPVAVATSIFVVVVTVLVASVGHVIGFISEGPEVIEKAIEVAMFTAPGVLIGGQLGPWVQSKVNPDTMKVAIAVLFAAVGAVMLWTLA